MSKPTSRSEFADYVLRGLGQGVTKVRVTPEQLEDRIDEALSYYADYHFDATDKVYFKHQITQTDKDNKFITLPDNIIGAVNIFPLGIFGSVGSDLFSAQYQMVVADLYTASSISLVPYVMTMEHITLIGQLISGQQPIRYTRHMNKLYLDMNWDRINIGQHVIVEAYQVIDPDEFTDVWSDRWLYKYTKALVKRQWGENLMQFSGMQLPGGVTYNGDRLFEEGNREVEELEAKMISDYSIPPLDMIG